MVSLACVFFFFWVGFCLVFELLFVFYVHDDIKRKSCSIGMLLLTFCILSLWPGNLAHTKGKGTGSGRLSSRQRSPQRSVNIVKVYTALEKIMYAFCFSPSVHLFRFLSDLYFLPLCTRLYFSKDGSADVVQTPVSQRGNNTDFSIRPQEMDVACAACIVFPTVCVCHVRICTCMYLDYVEILNGTTRSFPAFDLRWMFNGLHDSYISPSL